MIYSIIFYVNTVRTPSTCLTSHATLCTSSTCQRLRMREFQMVLINTVFNSLQTYAAPALT